jgi:transcriptional regulator with XRE-family HTH domain
MKLKGYYIAKLRNELKISQNDLSCELDCPRSLISKIEAGKHKQIALCTAYKLAKFFNVSMESLIE